MLHLHDQFDLIFIVFFRLRSTVFSTVFSTAFDCFFVYRYHGALDGALQSYHAIKVKEINMIIKEIWQICYKGGDVDMIEVRSDPTKATKTRARSYNYRIVMTKGNTELDMRGRCSAG